MSARGFLTYGTVILAIGVVSLTLAWTIRAVFGLFYVGMVSDFGWSRTGGSLGYAVSWLMLAVFSPLLGTAIDRWGTAKVMALGAVALAASLGLSATIQNQWQYILYFGVLGALGINAMTMAGGVLVPRWFVKNRGAAMGVVATGNSIGPLIFFPVFERYIAAEGWREPLVAYGIVALLFAPIAWLFIREFPGAARPGAKSSGAAMRPASESAAAYPKGFYTMRDALRSSRYWALFLLYFCGVVSYQVLLVHQVAHADAAGISRTASTSVFAVLNGVTIVGSLIGGWASDRVGREWPFFLGSLLGTLGIFAFAAAAFTPNIGFLWAYALGNGIGFGARIALLRVLSADVFMGPNFGRVTGWLGTANALGGFIGPLLGGYIFDITQSYVIAIAISALTLFASGALVWAVAPRKGILAPRGQTERATAST